MGEKAEKSRSRQNSSEKDVSPKVSPKVVEKVSKEDKKDKKRKLVENQMTKSSETPTKKVKKEKAKKVTEVKQEKVSQTDSGTGSLPSSANNTQNSTFSDDKPTESKVKKDSKKLEHKKVKKEAANSTKSQSTNLPATLKQEPVPATITGTRENPLAIPDENGKVWRCPVCKLPEIGEEWVACDGPCAEWYHYSCVNINPKRPPKGDWYCKSCREKLRAKKFSSGSSHSLSSNKRGSSASSKS